MAHFIRTLALCIALIGATSLRAADDKNVILLWPDGAPAAKGKEAVDQPTLTVSLPESGKANGTAVVVCPGGGYGGLAMDHEGRQVADWLNSQGVAAFVLKYRLGPRYRHPAPLQDAQRALRTVRSRAKEWHVDPHRIGIWGFSAGGHLASTAGTHFDKGNADASDPIERASCRPDFLILAYPVITLEPPYAHMGSRRNLLGNDPDPKLVESLCNDRQVTSETPPTFLMHTDEDRGVVPENSVLFYLALRKAKVPAELHIYEKGKHGVGLALKPADPVLSTWKDRLAAWMKGRGLLGELHASASSEQQPASGTVIGEVKGQQDTPDGKNTFIEVLAPGEEKARKYHVLYDAKLKGPIESVLKAVRAAKMGDRVELQWVQTGHGPAIKEFKVLRKADGKAK